MSTSSKRPASARIQRGRTASDRADEHGAHEDRAGIRPLTGKAMGAQVLGLLRSHANTGGS